MKFLCISEFIHSGETSYFPGNVYSDITRAKAEELIALDKKKPLGALSFFTPADDEAAAFVKEASGGDGGKADDPSKTGKDGASEDAEKAGLLAEARSLGIKGANFMGVERLKEAVAEKKAAAGQRNGTEQ